MALTVDEIRALFPKGAVQTKNRFKPARTKAEATKTLAKMLADKRKRVRRDVPHLMKPGSGYTSDPKYALGVRNRYCGEFGEPEPESPSTAELDDYATENWQRFLGGLEGVGSRNPKLYVQRRKKAA